MRYTGDFIVRAAALAAVVVVAVVVAVLLLGSGGGYKVKARFQNAAQLVKGNLVQTGGVSLGTVEKIDLTAKGEAEVTMKIEGDYAPLRRGTLATIRQASLSGVANRYIDLRMAPQSAAKIPDGGVIEQDSTTTAVDLDQLFNTFDPDTREALAGVIKGSARQFKGKGKEFNEGIAYLNPSRPPRAACSGSSIATRRCSSASSSRPRSSSRTSPTAGTTSPGWSTTSRPRRRRSATRRRRWQSRSAGCRTSSAAPTPRSST